MGLEKPGPLPPRPSTRSATANRPVSTMDDEATPIDTRYLSASGTSYEDAVFIGQRFDADRGFRPRESESWILCNEPADGGVKTSLHIPSSTWYEAVWRSPSGQVFLADPVNRAVYRCERLSDAEGGMWNDHRFPAAIHGVWGLSDDAVFAWGGHGERFPMFRWNGDAWTDMPDPGFEVFALHGTSPTCLWAVGDAGQVAFWDGGRWYPFSTPTRENLNAVFVCERDRAFATGVHGSLLEGGTRGWTKIADGPAPHSLFAVAWWGDALWVGARQGGLLRRVGRTSTLEVVKPNIWATALEAGTNLLITAPRVIASTADGATFLGAGTGVLDRHTDGRPLRWFRSET